MPRVPRYTIDALRDLDRQLSYAPAATRRRHMDSVERLIVDIEPDRNYPEDFIIFRITGYRSDKKDTATFVGQALLRDLSSLITALSDGLDMPVDPARPAVTIEDAAARLGVSAKTIQRYRRGGLICHYLIGDDQKKRLSCFVDQLDAFAAAHAARTAKAKGFTRIDDATAAAIIEEARSLQACAGVSLNEAARRLAARHRRAHETIRQLLRRHDNGDGEPIFTSRGPLTERQIRLIGRASRWDVPVSRLANRFGKTRPTIHRAINDCRARHLQSLDLQWIDLPTFALDDADRIILTPAAVTRGMIDPPQATHAISLIRWAHEDHVADEHDEDALLAAYNALKRRAATGIEHLREPPGSDDLDRIETDLRWAAMVKRRLMFLGLPAAIVAIERALGRGLHTQPTEMIVILLASAYDVTARAADQVDPTRSQRMARLSTFFMDRAMAARRPADQRARAVARHVEGTIPIADLASRSIPWQRLVNLPLAHQYVIDRIKPIERDAIKRRYGLEGEPPLTIAELCATFACKRLAMMNRLANARRHLRRAASDDGR